MAVSLVNGHFTNLLLSDWSRQIYRPPSVVRGHIEDTSYFVIGPPRFNWPPHWTCQKNIDLLFPHWLWKWPPDSSLVMSMTFCFLIGYVNDFLLPYWLCQWPPASSMVMSMTSCFLLGLWKWPPVPHWSCQWPPAASSLVMQVNCLFIGQHRLTWPPHWSCQWPPAPKGWDPGP